MRTKQRTPLLALGAVDRAVLASLLVLTAVTPALAEFEIQEIDHR